MTEERVLKCLQVKHTFVCTWSFVTQIFHDCQPSHGGDVKLPKWWLQIKTNIYIGTLCLVASLLAVILYQENYDRNHKLWNIVSTERCVLNGKIETTCTCTFYLLS